MGYADDQYHIQDISLMRFAIKRSNAFLERRLNNLIDLDAPYYHTPWEAENPLVSLAGLVAGSVGWPFLFAGNLVAGAVAYRRNNSFIEGTPEHEDWVNGMRIIPNEVGVRVIYPSDTRE